MKFTKMHGCGNDYVYINCFEEKVANPEKLAQAMSDRHFGIGSDGIVLIMPSEVADCRMRMFNADGSEAEMCGIKVIEVHTDAEGKAETLTVDMGEPILAPKDIPVVADSEPVVDLTLSSCGKDFDFTCVSMGNPHAVTFIDTPVKEFEVEKYGPSLEVDSHFPRKANIEFVEIVDETHLRMRVWERGTGETLACGTGTCATVVASNIKGICPRVPVEVELVGGKLTIEWKPEDNHVYMTGPATFVFDGVWED